MNNNLFANHMPECVLDVCVTSDDKQNPVVAFKFSSETVNVPIINAFDIHHCNEFLRSLDTGINVEFITYEQYAELINCISHVIRTRMCASCKVTRNPNLYVTLLTESGYHKLYH